jgi:hypothetical protein
MPAFWNWVPFRQSSCIGRWDIDAQLFQTLVTQAAFKPPPLHQGYEVAPAVLTMIRVLAFSEPRSSIIVKYAVTFVGHILLFLIGPAVLVAISVSANESAVLPATDVCH